MARAVKISWQVARNLYALKCVGPTAAFWTKCLPFYSKCNFLKSTSAFWPLGSTSVTVHPDGTGVLKKVSRETTRGMKHKGLSGCWPAQYL